MNASAAYSGPRRGACSLATRSRWTAASVRAAPPDLLTLSSIRVQLAFGVRPANCWRSSNDTASRAALSLLTPVNGSRRQSSANARPSSNGRNLVAVRPHPLGVRIRFTGGTGTRGQRLCDFGRGGLCGGVPQRMALQVRSVGLQVFVLSRVPIGTRVEVMCLTSG